MEGAVEVIVPNGSAALEVFLRVGEDRRLYRVLPARDPRQPRFWCLAVMACTPSGMPEPEGPLWAGAWGTTWSEVPGTIAAIRADAAGWLAAEPQRGLRERLRERLADPWQAPRFRFGPGGELESA